MAGIVPNPVIITVGIEDYRPLPVLRLQTVGIELGLLLADTWVLARALRLNQRQRFAVIAAQYVVDIADAGRIRHALNFNFDCVRRLGVETSFA